MKPVDIKFNSPTKYEKYLSRKSSLSNAKGNKISLTEYLALQDLKAIKSKEMKNDN